MLAVLQAAAKLSQQPRKTPNITEGQAVALLSIFAGDTIIEIKFHNNISNPVALNMLQMGLVALADRNNGKRSIALTHGNGAGGAPTATTEAIGMHTIEIFFANLHSVTDYHKYWTCVDEMTMTIPQAALQSTSQSGQTVQQDWDDKCKATGVPIPTFTRQQGVTFDLTPWLP
eukprot:TRINITY_DN112267_c0_g1_i1.p1 TRINITY_DN112267_c0_g1~~TRINITY_DN112267_c0_g1_i1.p1  ORF type:complete len:173 (-),score=37.54 TRINITY_DN112267_c0_g1_i1:115-633(-)